MGPHRNVLLTRSGWEGARTRSSQRDRDRLVVLKKALKKLITQRQAGCLSSMKPALAMRQRRDRLTVIHGLPLLDIPPQVDELAEGILASGAIPRKAAADAAHIASPKSMEWISA